MPFPSHLLSIDHSILKMEDPFASIIEQCKYSSSQEDILNNSRFAFQDEFLSDDDGGSPVSDGALAAAPGIIICSAPETPDSKDDIPSLNEEFNTPPESSRRSTSCKGLTGTPQAGGSPKLGGLVSVRASRGQDIVDSDSAHVKSKSKTAVGVKENLGFSKARIGEMMEILSDGKVRIRDAPKVEAERVHVRKETPSLKDDSARVNSKSKTAVAVKENLGLPKARISEMMESFSDGKVRGRDAPRVEAEQVHVRKGTTTLKDDSSKTPLKKQKASGVVSRSRREGLEALKARLREMTDIPSSHSAPENVQCTEPLETVPVENDQEEVADLDDLEGDNPGNKELNLPKETREDRIRRPDGDGETRSNGKGVDSTQGCTQGAPGRRYLPDSLLRPADSRTVVDKDTMVRNLMDLLSSESQQITKDRNKDGRKEKILDPDCRSKAVGKEPSAAGKKDEGDKVKFILDVLESLTRGVKRKYDCDDVDLIETAKRRGMTFPRPRWWPDSVGDKWCRR